MEKLQLTAEKSGERIDKFLGGTLEGLSRSYIQKLLKEGNITVDSKAVKNIMFVLKTGNTLRQ